METRSHEIRLTCPFLRKVGGTRANWRKNSIWEIENACHIRNTRFDPDLIEFHGIAKQMAASVGYTADLSVDGRLAQLLRLRVAQMNPCSLLPDPAPKRPMIRDRG